MFQEDLLNFGQQFGTLARLSNAYDPRRCAAAIGKFLRLFAGVENDGKVSELLHLPQLCTNLIAVLMRHVDVKHDQIGRTRASQTESLLPGRRLNHVVAGGGKLSRKQ